MQAAQLSNAVEVKTVSYFDMPVTHYWMSSGRRKRRVDAQELSMLLDTVIDQAHKLRVQLHVVVERPTPIPDIDGWQSAALSGTPLCLHCCTLHRFALLRSS